MLSATLSARYSAPLTRTKPRPPEQGASAAARSERKGLQRCPNLGT
nr:MAG TPA: hypothetical protein [Bacteriophage sp.]